MRKHFFFSVQVLLVFGCVCSGGWSGWDESKAILSLARIGSRLFCGCRNGEIRVWQFSATSNMEAGEGEEGAPRKASQGFTTQNEKIVATVDSGWEFLDVLTGHAGRIEALLPVHDRLVSAGSDGQASN